MGGCLEFHLISASAHGYICMHVHPHAWNCKYPTNLIISLCGLLLMSVCLRTGHRGVILHCIYALTVLSSCLFQHGCQKVGRKINEVCVTEPEVDGDEWLLFSSLPPTHCVMMSSSWDTGLAQLVVVFYIPAKTTAFWLITHWRYIGLVW